MRLLKSNLLAAAAVPVAAAVITAPRIAAVTDPDQQPSCATPPTDADIDWSWHDVGHMSVEMSTPIDDQTQAWHLSFFNMNGDFKIDPIVDGEVNSAETLLVVAGQLLFTRAQLDPGVEIDAVDAPLLTAQIVLKSLGYLIPEGAASIDRPIKLD